MVVITFMVDITVMMDMVRIVGVLTMMSMLKAGKKNMIDVVLGITMQDMRMDIVGINCRYCGSVKGDASC